MKKLMCGLLVLGMAVVGCSNNTVNSIKENEPKNKTVKMGTVLNGVSTTEKLEDVMNKDVEDTISKLENKVENLRTKITSYDLYIENLEEIKETYNLFVKETNELGIRMREYSYKYAEIVLKEGENYKDKYKTLKDVYDDIYDGSAKDMLEIYDKTLKGMYDLFYSGVLEDAYDNLPGDEYDTWYDLRSDEYDVWYDARSDVYDICSDARSDIYDFTSDLRSEVYDHDDERMEKVMDDFKEDINKLKK